ncbi:MAG TPA: hypothetical protein DDZ51_09715 [Planctomycetaceae bacterium]|nr:hypothetical protein [Planctomycetaceae bacterium]
MGLLLIGFGAAGGFWQFKNVSVADNDSNQLLPPSVVINKKNLPVWVELKNESNIDVELLDLFSDCGCVASRIPRQVIPGGGSLKIPVKIAVDRIGDGDRKCLYLKYKPTKSTIAKVDTCCFILSD